MFKKGSKTTDLPGGLTQYRGALIISPFQFISRLSRLQSDDVSQDTSTAEGDFRLASGRDGHS